MSGPLDLLSLEDQRDTLALLIHAQDYHESEAKVCKGKRLRDEVKRHETAARLFGERATALSARMANRAKPELIPGAMP